MATSPGSLGAGPGAARPWRLSRRLLLLLLLLLPLLDAGEAAPPPGLVPILPPPPFPAPPSRQELVPGMAVSLAVWGSVTHYLMITSPLPRPGISPGRFQGSQTPALSGLIPQAPPALQPSGTCSGENLCLFSSPAGCFPPLSVWTLWLRPKSPS